MPDRFFRFCGWMLLISGILTIVIQFVHLEDVPSGMEQMDYFVDVAVWTHIGLVLAFAMFLMGFVGLYLRQAAGLKWWGWLSFVCFFLFFTLDGTHSPIQIFGYPVIYERIQNAEQLQAANDLAMKIGSIGPGFAMMTALFPLILLGTLLMGISMLRAKILSQWPAVAMLVSTVFIFIPYTPETKYLAGLFPYLIFAWYGWILAFEKREGAYPDRAETGHL
ncbi:hypothetical protein [Cohnella caldifontis]|uniref:hypothetical protein n=1 Tax=Cohnella caldifontis TaxID=3027471 RepID=UPI0023EC3157|nr:hypothetical protein [Cohnella sp. YIM B05605]